MSAQVAQDLRAAAEVLRRDGWTQGDFGVVEGCKCLYGAINYVASGGETVDDELMPYDELQRANAAGRVVQQMLGFAHPIRVAEWNDVGSRTADEVIAALEAAADAADRAVSEQ